MQGKFDGLWCLTPLSTMLYSGGRKSNKNTKINMNKYENKSSKSK
jgi:hypothetical protein